MDLLNEGEVIARLENFIDKEFVPGPVPTPESPTEVKEIAHMKRWGVSKKLTTLSEASSGSARREDHQEFDHQTIKRSATARRSLAPVDLEGVEGPPVSPPPRESPQPSKRHEFRTPHLTRLGDRGFPRTAPSDGGDDAGGARETPTDGAGTVAAAPSAIGRVVDGSFRKAVHDEAAAELLQRSDKDNKEADMTRIDMSKDNDRDGKYTFLDPKTCSLKRSDPVSHSLRMHRLFQLLQDFVLLVVKNYFRENGEGLPELFVQDMLLHMTSIIAHALKIDIKMCDGRNCPKLVLANGNNVYAGFLDLFGLMKYSDLEVVAFIMEVKAKEVRSGQQCTQLMNQIQAVSARQTEGCNYTLNDGPTSVSSIGVRMCEAVHSNGVIGTTLLCLGPEPNLQEQPARSVFFIEAETNTFRLIADALVRAERTRTHCVEKNKISSRSSTSALPSTPGSGSGAGGFKTGQPPQGGPDLGSEQPPANPSSGSQDPLTGGMGNSGGVMEDAGYHLAAPAFTARSCFAEGNKFPKTKGLRDTTNVAVLETFTVRSCFAEGNKFPKTKELRDTTTVAVSDPRPSLEAPDGPRLVEVSVHDNFASSIVAWNAGVLKHTHDLTTHHTASIARDSARCHSRISPSLISNEAIAEHDFDPLLTSSELSAFFIE